MINHVDVEVGKVRAEMNVQFDAQEAIAKGLGDKLKQILDALVQPTRKDSTEPSVALVHDDNEQYTIITPPTIIYDDNCQVEEGDEVESGVCKTPVEEKLLQIRKHNRFYLRPYINELVDLGNGGRRTSRGIGGIGYSMIRNLLR